jgi:hypothetical protein
MSESMPRRRFLQKTLAAAALVQPGLMSLEERCLSARAAVPEPAGVPALPLPDNWLGRIGDVKISRIICGGNLLSGYAHSRDLIYVSRLLKSYHTDEKIMQTWAACEQNGINTMIFNPHDARAVAVYARYRKEGGRIQFIAQMDGPAPENLRATIEGLANAGAVGAFLVGNDGDRWSREGKVDRIGEIVSAIQDFGLIAGVAGHEVRTARECEKAGLAPDFYVKTLHHADYWSRRKIDGEKDVIDNYGTDNYWCRDPEETASFMAGIQRPWIAYKVLAAGAIQPSSGFEYAFSKGADFALVGMFDFQVAENVETAGKLLAGGFKDRTRAWVA